jgi:transketolase
MAVSNLRAFGSGFLIFSDYMRASIRLSAISEIPVTWIFTHDSIGVGEDGPTHQPVEHLASLRGMPGLHTIRPCDANEVVEAWRVLLREKHGPTCLALSRQPLPTLDRSKYASAAGLARGAYVLADPPDGGKPELILMATGSEVSLCVGAYETLTAEGVRVRVVSMPCWDIFEQQDEAYRRSMFPDDVLARVAVEQAATLGWDRYVGLQGKIIGMHTFGASAPLKALLERFGFTAEGVLSAAREQLARHATMRKAAE